MSRETEIQIRICSCGISKICGGGTIPLLQAWLYDGMSMGSAAAFMITGPATKITNLGAVKIVLGAGRFALYLGFVMLFSLVIGIAVNVIMLHLKIIVIG